VTKVKKETFHRKTKKQLHVSIIMIELY